MTTNAGASDLAKPAIGFGSGIREGDDHEAINRMFSPEFRNRSTLRSPFPRCRPRRSAESSTSSCFSSRNSSPIAGVTIELDASARAWLAEKGYDPLFGARLLARVIQEHIKSRSPMSCCSGGCRKAGSSGHEEAG